MMAEFNRSEDIPVILQTLIKEKINAGAIMKTEKLEAEIGTLPGSVLSKEQRLRVLKEPLPRDIGETIRQIPFAGKPISELGKIFAGGQQLSQQQIKSMFVEGLVSEEDFIRSIREFEPKARLALYEEAIIARKEKIGKKVEAAEAPEKQAAAQAAADEEARIRRLQDIEQGVGMTGEQMLSREEFLESVKAAKPGEVQPGAAKFAEEIEKERKARKIRARQKT